MSPFSKGMECQYCHKFYSLDFIKRHIRYYCHANPSNLSNVKCPNCGLVFTTRRGTIELEKTGSKCYQEVDASTT